MDESLRHQRDTSLGRLEALIRQGRQIKAARSIDATRAWQQDCAAAINQLSGGSKAHWLARAFSGAFLVRAADGGVVVEAGAADIVDRILDVLAEGAASLSRMDDVAAASSGAAPRPRRFEFVHDVPLRPVCERTFDDSRRALEDGQFGLALILSCGVIEAIITDALLHCGSGVEEGRPESGFNPSIESAAGDLNPPFASAISHHSGAARRVTLMSFADRIAAAEREGLICRGCARLPPAARRYRELTDAEGQLRPDADVSEREARVTGQVLRVVMRDLDPGR